MQISETMALDLLEAYTKRILLLEKLKGLNASKVEMLRVTSLKADILKGQLKEIGYDVDSTMREITERESKIISSSNVRVHTDGAARGNNDPGQPNRSAIGFAVYLNDRPFHEEARYIGAETPIPITKSQTETDRMVVPATNNTSEYLAIIAALEYLIEAGYTSKRVEIFSDSNVVVQQINMTNASRAPHLIQLRNVARELMAEFDDIRLTHVLRKESAYVDKLVNDIIDEHERGESDG
jgi:ribonuclease HI